MIPSPVPPSRRRPRRARLLGALAAAALVATLGGQAPAAATVTVPPVPGNGPTSTPGGHTHTVTLLTGDVVVLHVAPDGRQAAWVQEPAGGSAPAARIYQLDGQVHVVPAEAEPYLTSGALDSRLFNITQLVAQGYDDASRSDLPLLLSAPADTSPGTLALPVGMREHRQLDSVAAVAASADKSRIRAAWESLRGPDPVALSADDAQLAGVDRIWLNETVRATLGDSVPVVGAPAVWDAGFDGTGVTVAVLDTGWDPDHPDLAGKVTGAHNFTFDPDPPGVAGVDRHGHGTHVAATVAGTGAASGGVHQGVAPGADLLIGKVLGDDGGGMTDWVIAGMEWAVEQDAQVVNLSLGGDSASDGTDPLSLAVDRLTEESGVLFVIAAGNAGPDEQTVSSPGAATRALTVGATTNDDQEAWFSSRGPRLGDLAIKPEIVAPGVDIVAARAAGTSLGSLVDDHHSSMSGTSMAAPHVAGAAAILAQQHPDLDAEALKARLVSTSVPLDEAISFQGAGRLDIAAAVASDLSVDHAAVSLGRLDRGSGNAEQTLTYHNHSDRAVVLRLSSDVTSTGVRDDRKPVLRVRPAALVIPPGGEASARVELLTDATRPGSYTGHVTARDLRGDRATVHTVISAFVDGPLHTVTVTAVDREGVPAPGRTDIWSAETGELVTLHLSEGRASVALPEGLYSVVTTVITPDGAGDPASFTVSGEPDLTIRRDVDLHVDARDAKSVEVATPRDSELTGFDVMWFRQVGDRTVAGVAAQGWGAMELFMVPSRSVRTGTFETSITWREAQPLLTVQVGGDDGFRLRPSPTRASARQAFVGQESLPIVYAGHGTPEEFAEVDVAGRIALVTRQQEAGGGDPPFPFDFDDDIIIPPDPPYPPFPPEGPPPALVRQAEAAHEAGATLLLAHNDAPGSWGEWLEDVPLPTYTIGEDAGMAIQQALDAHPNLTVDLSGVGDSTYNYELVFLERGRIPAGGSHDVSGHALATVESEYREDSARMGRNEWWVPYIGSSGLTVGTEPGVGANLTRYGPVRRTEYVSATDVQWQRFAQPQGEFLNMYWTWSGVDDYQPDHTYHQVWWGPLTRPGVPAIPGWEGQGMPVARFHDAIRISIPQYLHGNGFTHTYAQDQLGDFSQLTLRRDGEVVGTSPWPQAQFSVPAAESDYELELVVINGYGNFMDTSVRTESMWRFRSERPDNGYQPLPLVQLDFDLAANMYNEVPAGQPYQLGIAPGYQPGADGPEGFTVKVEVSYDDGDSWVPAPVASGDGGSFEATMPAAGDDAAFASVRVVATDASGDSLTQVIERAWRIGAR